MVYYSDWHGFDVERGYDVREVRTGPGGELVGFEIRHDGDDNEITELSVEEFEQLRAEGPNPKDL